MPRLTIEDKLELMENVSRIAAEAVKNPDVVRDVDLQMRLIEDIYHTMVALLEEDEGEDEDDED